MSKKVENWKKAIYSKSENIDNTAGDIFRELSDGELDGIIHVVIVIRVNILVVTFVL